MAGLARAPEAKLRATLEAQGYVSIALRRTGQHHWFLFGQVAGRRRSCLIDTGWTYTSVSPVVAQHLSSTNRIERLKLGKLQLDNIPIRVVELQVNGQPTGYDVVLGCDLLLAHQALIDFGRARLYLRPNPATGISRDALAAGLAATGRKAVSLQLLNPPVLAVPATVHGVGTQLLVDSGAMWSCLDAEFARRATLSTAASVQRLSGPGANGQRNFAVADLVAWSLGSIPLAGRSVAVLDLADWGLGPRATLFPRVEGILGGAELLTTRAWLDCGQLKLWLVSPH